MAKYVAPTIDQILSKLKYMSPEELIRVRQAYELAERLHRGQKRSSGEDYITHPLAVADILTDLKAGVDTIIAGLLHDVVEDCDYTPEEIEEQFGTRVMKLVMGVTKLSKQTARELEPTDGHGKPLNGNGHGARRAPTRKEEWAENMRQLFMSSVEHPLILVIKLADRLHNMRTLYGHSSEAKRRRIAQETLEIFAPVANRLGMWQIKWELEDLSFRYLEPDTYQQIKHELAQRRETRERFVKQVEREIRRELDKAGIQGEVEGRPKHIYSIWRKMQRKGVPFKEIYDVHGFRIIVDTVADCYAVLGLIHNRWTPIPGEFDDYIARPKDNGYQSLHTAVIGPGGKHMEVQIRTREMHEMAEQGVAAHWRYKEDGGKYDASFANKVAWLRALVQYEEEEGSDAEQMVENIRTDLFSDRVYVFTPKGDLISLPAGATPVDFAYHIHTEVGHRCRGARVNGKLVKLNYQLQNRDRVEIITARRGGPSRDWLNPNLGYVRTSRARSKIKSWFRKQDREQNIQAGRMALDRLLKQLNIRIGFDEVARILEYDTVEDMLSALGYGDLSTERIAGKLIDLQHQAKLEAMREQAPDEPDILPPQARPGDRDVKIRGVEGLEYRMAKCCHPMPGEPIAGYITRGRGVTIHRQDCHNLLHLSEREPERIIDISWGIETPTYPVTILVKAWNRAGLLNDITRILANEKINIRGSTTKSNHRSPFASIILTIEVKNVSQLTRVMDLIDRVANVISVKRTRGNQHAG
ncbi:MAG TPA: bifunctional (p)ppGpp synthetase/guanosine-3',5'-bis(diphosphate) 3'-pyrophosphohydrolase [Caldilineae bacterium]|nr:bifunctional (p)ppGpp synthetase/guanosine-3',5'-bis(diphosphate) 3'-pyrophosphohydrolase [Caldilineae bacterium]